MVTADSIPLFAAQKFDPKLLVCSGVMSIEECELFNDPDPTNMPGLLIFSLRNQSSVAHLQGLQVYPGVGSATSLFDSH
jgi:hypothetical protein